MSSSAASPGALAVSVRGLGKSYTIARDAERHRTLAEAAAARLRRPLRRARTEEFWALRDVSFDIGRGEVVGIVGRNGAGKSTLLKVLSRITQPTVGEVDLYGRVGSLLEVGTGFHPELTGRENIFLNGAILGMPRVDITRQFDAIVDFAGVERFLDTPVKRYSSGMYVRLAFAVAAHLEPDILVVDEVLAVGDAEFQQKCLGKMQAVAGDGRTVLLVSHNTAAVSALCTSAVVLRAGCVAYQGDVGRALALYAAGGAQPQDTAGSDLQAFRPGWAQPAITAARLLDSQGRARRTFPLGDDVTVELMFDVGELPPLRQPSMGLVIRQASGAVVGGVNMRMCGYRQQHGALRAAVMRGELSGLNLLPGEHTVDLWLAEGGVDVDHLAGCLTFTVEEGDVYGSGVAPSAQLGAVYLNARWAVEPVGVGLVATAV